MSSISSRLDDEPEAEPTKLQGAEDKVFVGSCVHGSGFILTPDQAKVLVERDARNRECLFPYINGEDLNFRPDQSASRWVINFFDWPLEKAGQYPDLLEIVEEKVRPIREQVRRERYKQRWWLHAENRPGLYASIKDFGRVLIKAQISEHHMLVFVSSRMVFDQKIVVFAVRDYASFAILQSPLHEVWARKYGSTLESRYTYTPSDVFYTFPFPTELSPQMSQELESAGTRYHDHRILLMAERNIGPTPLYNLMHDHKCEDKEIDRFRKLHAELVHVTFAAYGWGDMSAEPTFGSNERGQARFIMPTEARREMLHRLLELNQTVAHKP